MDAMLRISHPQIHYDIHRIKLCQISVAFRKGRHYIRRVMQIKVENINNWWWPVVQTTAGQLR